MYTKIKNTIGERIPALWALLTERRWAHVVGELAYHSKSGVFVPDIYGTIDPLFWYHDDRLNDSEFERIAIHDFSLGDREIPAMSSEPAVSRFLAKWILLRNARNVLEIGSFLGFTSSHMALALSRLEQPGQLTCIDIDAKYLGIAGRNVAALAPDLARKWFIEGYSTDQAVMAQLDPGYDLIFIDSAHDEYTTRAEVELYKPLLNPGGALAFHDAISWPGVRRAVKSVQKDFETLIFATSRGCGLALLVDQRKPE